MGEDETQTLAALKAHRKELIDPLIAEHKGHIVKTTGDGLLLEFPSVVEAVACAVAVQRAMLERNRAVPEGRRIELRVGINIGDVIIEDGDIFGNGVNVAARLEQISEPGGICLSDDAYRQVRDKLDIEALDTGEQHLKNIANPVRVYRIDPASSATGIKRLSGIRGGRASRLRLAMAGLAVIVIAIAAWAAWSGIGRAPAPEQQAASSTATKPDSGPILPIVAV
ncbi:adenylate/guanylate cyclase domain-containing protein, partial [Mesorhizobium muleiense]|uniref:adenylate/guanylate cyclase domain-containing protein n=1 Tax=Mesorhizobium muleiense TaxID=1004279 RepID=UPI001F26B238